MAARKVWTALASGRGRLYPIIRSKVEELAREDTASIMSDETSCTATVRLNDTYRMVPIQVKLSTST